MDYVPDFPSLSEGPASVRTDGRWGIWEYSRWPQMYNEQVPHHMCIPSRPIHGRKIHQYYLSSGIPEPHQIFFRTLTTSDWRETPDCGIVSYGLIEQEHIQCLERHAYAVCISTERLLMKVERVSDTVKNLLRNLKATMRQLLERLRSIPCKFEHALIAFSHFQRLGLEVYGLHIYYHAYDARLRKMNNCSKLILPIVGTFTSDPLHHDKLFHYGIPVWLIVDKRMNTEGYQQVTTPYDLAGLESTLLYSGISPITLDSRLHTVKAFHWENLSKGLSALMMKLSCDVKFPSMPFFPPVIPSTTHRSSQSSPPPKRARIDHPMAINLSDISKKSRKRGTRSKSTNIKPQKPPFPRVFSYEDVEGWPKITEAWQARVTALSPLPSPPADIPALYYYPPPIVFENVKDDDTKRFRYLHNYLRIRQFLKVRLLSPGVGGKPLRIRDWKQVLWGNYNPNEFDEITLTQVDLDTKKAVLLEFLATGGALLSYSQTDTPRYRNINVDLDTVKDDFTVMRNVLWEVREVNFRCELRALDEIILKMDTQDEFRRRSRIQELCSVWGATSGGDSVVPVWEGLPLSSNLFYWTAPGEKDWEKRRETLANFIRFLSSWPLIPQSLLIVRNQVATCVDPMLFGKWEKETINFYVDMFVSYFHRMPTVPCVCPLTIVDVAE